MGICGDVGVDMDRHKGGESGEKKCVYMRIGYNNRRERDVWLCIHEEKGSDERLSI